MLSQGLNIVKGGAAICHRPGLACEAGVFPSPTSQATYTLTLEESCRQGRHTNWDGAALRSRPRYALFDIHLVAGIKKVLH